MGKVLQLAVLLFSYAHALQHTYRVVFRDVHAAFRNEDIHSAAHDLGGRVAHVSATSARLHLPDDAAAAMLAERSVLVRYVLEEWGAGATLREAASRACVPPNSLLATGASWRIRVQSPGRRTGLVNAHDPTLFEALGGVLDALPGPVRLKDAEEDVAVLMRGEEVAARPTERIHNKVAGPHARERRRDKGQRRVHRRRAAVGPVRDAVLAQHIGCAAAGYYSSYHNFLASHKHGDVLLGVL